ncbi:MAG: ACT domain-containing protein [Chthoniobacterales bacterium]|nr:ACT domain-containing protein [Chthoniobacterales bacterium]
MVKIVTQLAVFIENKPGTLASVCDALATEGINIYGLATSDTTDHNVVRLVVSDPDRALEIFEERGTLVVESDVLMVENRNQPGALSKIARALAKKRINIEYAYLASHPGDVRGLLILRVSNAKAALTALKALRI